MTWIKVNRPDRDPELQQALQQGMARYPKEYDPANLAERQVPEAVKRDNIVLAHSLIPRALEHVFAGYAALLDPSLPLTRREHELIAATVSSINSCFY